MQMKPNRSWQPVRPIQLAIGFGLVALGLVVWRWLGLRPEVRSAASQAAREADAERSSAELRGLGFPSTVRTAVETPTSSPGPSSDELALDAARMLLLFDDLGGRINLGRHPELRAAEAHALLERFAETSDETRRNRILDDLSPFGDVQDLAQELAVIVVAGATDRTRQVAVRLLVGFGQEGCEAAVQIAADQWEKGRQAAADPMDFSHNLRWIAEADPQVALPLELLVAGELESIATELDAAQREAEAVDASRRYFSADHPISRAKRSLMVAMTVVGSLAASDQPEAASRVARLVESSDEGLRSEIQRIAAEKLLESRSPALLRALEPWATARFSGEVPPANETEWVLALLVAAGTQAAGRNELWARRSELDSPAKELAWLEAVCVWADRVGGGEVQAALREVREHGLHLRGAEEGVAWRTRQLFYAAIVRHGDDEERRWLREQVVADPENALLLFEVLDADAWRGHELELQHAFDVIGASGHEEAERIQKRILQRWGEAAVDPDPWLHVLAGSPDEIGARARSQLQSIEKEREAVRYRELMASKDPPPRLELTEEDVSELVRRWSAGELPNIGWRAKSAFSRESVPTAFLEQLLLDETFPPHVRMGFTAGLLEGDRADRLELLRAGMVALVSGILEGTTETEAWTRIAFLAVTEGAGGRRIAQACLDVRGTADERPGWAAALSALQAWLERADFADWPAFARLEPEKR